MAAIMSNFDEEIGYLMLVLDVGWH